MDGGGTPGLWVSAGAGLPAEQVQALAVDPSDPLTAYVGFLSATASFGSGSGIYKTVDGGMSWSAINSGLVVPSSTLGTPAIYALSIDRQHPQTVYAGGFYGLWRSTDGGASWSWFVSVADGGGDVPGLTASRTVVAVDPTDSSHIYVGAHFGLWITADGGSSWTNLLAGPPVDAADIAIDPAHPRTAYARTNGNYFRVTNDAQVDGIETAQILIHTGVVDPTGALYVSASSVGAAVSVEQVLVSTDEGMTWTDAASGLGSLSMVPSMTFASSPPVAGTLYAVALLPQPADANAPALGRLFRFEGGSWNDVTGSLPSQISIVATGTSDPNTVYVGTSDGRVFRSSGRP
jgi:photosystem II stability/assembly factor-like uncharacterized protein